jgi:hypothetical protein
MWFLFPYYRSRIIHGCGGIVARLSIQTYVCSWYEHSRRPLSATDCDRRKDFETKCLTRGAGQQEVDIDCLSSIYPVIFPKSATTLCIE